MGRGSLRPRDGCCSEAALGRFPPHEPDLTGAKVFGECGERFVVGEKHPRGNPALFTLEMAEVTGKVRFRDQPTPAHPSPAPDSQPACPRTRLRTPHRLPGERHVLSHVFLFLFAHSSGLPADVNLLPRGQRPYAAPGASEHTGYLTGGSPAKDAEPPRPAILHPPPALSCPEPSRAQGRSHALARRAARAPAAPGRSSVPDAVCLSKPDSKPPFV